MHVAMTLVFDPSTVPGGLLVRADERGDRQPPPGRTGVPAAAGRGAVPPRSPGVGRRPRVRHRLPRAPGRGAQTGWAARAGRPDRSTSPATSSTGPGPCGRCGSSRVWPTTASASSPRCTIRPSTGSRGRSCSRCSSTSIPSPSSGPSRPTPPVDERVPSGLELMTQAAVARSMRPFEMTRDLVRTVPRVLNVRKVRLGTPDRSDTVQGCAPPVRPPDLVQRRPHLAPERGPDRHRPRRRQAGEERHRDHGQRRDPGRVHRGPPLVPAGGGRAPRQAAGGGGAGLGTPGHRLAQGLQPGCPPCSSSSRPISTAPSTG